MHNKQKIWTLRSQRIHYWMSKINAIERQKLTPLDVNNQQYGGRKSVLLRVKNSTAGAVLESVTSLGVPITLTSFWHRCSDSSPLLNSVSGVWNGVEKGQSQLFRNLFRNLRAPAENRLLIPKQMRSPLLKQRFRSGNKVWKRDNPNCFATCFATCARPPWTAAQPGPTPLLLPKQMRFWRYFGCNLRYYNN